MMTDDNAPGQDPEQVMADPETQAPPIADRPAREPAFNIPSVLLLVIGIMFAIFAAEQWLLSATTDMKFLSYFSFQPQRYLYPLAGQDLGWLYGPVTYSLLHGSVGHILSNTIWLVAFGTPVARRLPPVTFIVFWVLSAIFAAFFFAVVSGFPPTYLIGASGVVSAVSGAACRFAIAPNGFLPASLSHFAPRLTILQALSRRSVLTFAAFSIVSNLILGIGFGGQSGNNSVAWQAHIGGFLFGFLLFSLFDRRYDRKR